MPDKKEGRVSLDAPARIEADRLLQEEISRALENLADSLPHVADFRLARVLAELLESSWSEHASFQDQALFPIIIKRQDNAGEAVAVLSRLTDEHAEIRDRHFEIIQQITTLVDGGRYNAEMFGYLLRSVFESRRRHMEMELWLDRLLPPLLTPADLTALNLWNANRPRPPFPINLLLGKAGSSLWGA